MKSGLTKWNKVNFLIDKLIEFDGTITEKLKAKTKKALIKFLITSRNVMEYYYSLITFANVKYFRKKEYDNYDTLQLDLFGLVEPTNEVEIKITDVKKFQISNIFNVNLIKGLETEKET